MAIKVLAKPKSEAIPKQVATRLDPDLGEKLLVFCRESGRTPSEVARMALTHFLRNAKVKKEGASNE